ncbi:unnamed protein product [Peronospora destructor]|uniref:Uncharacterized protein n=1 Tax=Peronospora destructor TaxID=86335 RepID=A0AAV0TQ09_9STRA|nr:unnamed protein product [Peronospora destructor]
MTKMLTLEAASDLDTPSSSPRIWPQEVSNWTLQSDHILHAFLKRYSTDLFARTKQLENRVRDIAAEADSAHVRLKNTFNQFLMLSNNQFMENRVYDEEQEDFFNVETNETIPEKQEVDTNVDKTKIEIGDDQVASEKRVETATESIVTKYRSALDMGLEAMKLFVMMDEDEEEKSEILSPFETVLDIYNERPLPFIIGTREFLDDETLGLGAAPEESSDSASGSSYTSSYSSDSDSKSESSQASRENKRSHSRYHSSSEESEGSLIAEQPSRQRANSDESDTSGLFGRPPLVEPRRRRTNSDESDTSGLFGRQSAPEKLASSQSRASMSRDSRRRPVFGGDEDASDDSDWTSDSDDGGKKIPTHKQSSVRRRGQEALPPFATPSHARKNRFLDSSDEESDAGLFGLAPTIKPRVFTTDEAEELKQRSAVQSSTGTNPSTTMQQYSSKRLNSRRSDSFGSSSSDEEGGLLGAALEKKPSIAKAQQKGFRLPLMGETTSRRTNELESKYTSDSDAESTVSGLFGRPSGAVKDTKKTAAGVPVLPPLQQSRRLDFSDDSSDNDDDGGLFGAAPAEPVASVVQPVIAPPRHQPFSDSSSDDDGDDGALFGAAPKFTPRTTTVPPISAPRSQPVQRASQSGLFGEGDSDASDDSDGGGIFGANKAVTTTVSPVVATRPSPVVARDVSDTTVTAMTMTMEDFLVNLPQMTNDDWSDDDGGLFGVATSKPTPAKPTATPVPPVRNNPDLAPTQTATPVGLLFGSPAGFSVPIVHPPNPSAAARLRAAESSDSDSDSDWDGDGGLFGPPKSRTVTELEAAYRIRKLAVILTGWIDC